MGEPIAKDMAQTRNIVMQTRRLFLCFAYFIGCVTAMYLQIEYKNNSIVNGQRIMCASGNYVEWNNGTEKWT